MMSKLKASDNRKMVLKDGYWKRMDDLMSEQILPYLLYGRHEP